MYKLGMLALGSLLAAPAIAADMPVKAPVLRAAPAVAYNWTGCFIGGNVGGVWVKSDFTAAPPDPVQPLGSHDASSVIGGVQGGCDYQVGRWVFGIQGDYDWTSAKGEHPSFAAPNFLIRSRAKSLASVTGRIGYTWDRFLGYVRGGGAWERNEFDTIFIPTSVLFDSARGTFSGWTVGVGGEYAFTNYISGFAEYDYYDFGTRRVSFFTPAGAPTFNADVKERKHVFKVGLNARWGWVAPVTARY